MFTFFSSLLHLLHTIISGNVQNIKEWRTGQSLFCHVATSEHVALIYWWGFASLEAAAVTLSVAVIMCWCFHCVLSCLSCVVAALYVCVTWHVYFQVMRLLWEKHVSGPPVCNATNRPPPLLTPSPTQGRGLLLTGIALGPRVSALCCSVWWKCPPPPLLRRVEDGFPWQPRLRHVWRRLFERFGGTKLPFRLYDRCSGASSCPFARRLTDGYNGLIKSRGKSSELLRRLLLILPHGWVLKEGRERETEGERGF